VRKLLQRLTRLRGVPQARHVAERAIAPYVRDDVHQLLLDHQRTAERVSDLESQIAETLSVLARSIERIDRVETHLPTVLNSIDSTNSTTRLLMREADELKALIATQSHTDVSPADDFRAELSPHIDTIKYLLRRVETVRAEMMHELRYGPDRVHVIETKVVNAAALDHRELRLNIGAGHIAMDGYVNVDIRELPGIDLVASVDRLPFEPGTITEIFSSHVLEHFAELELQRKLLPYWYALLKSGGRFRAVVPDLEAMTEAYTRGELSFETLRSVVYGGQEYETDFHLTGFTPDSLSSLLTECGFRGVNIIAKGRPNGECLEFEISASKPA